MGVDIHLSAVSATSSYVGATLGIRHRLHDNNGESSLLVVERRFDESVAFATVHGTVFEVQFRHERNVAEWPDSAEGISPTTTTPS